MLTGQPQELSTHGLAEGRGTLQVMCDRHTSQLGSSSYERTVISQEGVRSGRPIAVLAPEKVRGRLSDFCLIVTRRRHALPQRA